MIKSKKELLFYIKADRIMNGLNSEKSLKEKLLRSVTNAYDIIKYLEYMRKYSYYKNIKNQSFIERLFQFCYGTQFRSLGAKLGFSIDPDALGYGVVIPHYGTIVVGCNVIGNYAVLHTSTCIAACNSIIGDGFNMCTGSVISKNVSIGNYVSVCSNSLVNKSFNDNVLLGGSPAIIKKDNYSAWWKNDGIKYELRIQAVEKLKKDVNL